MQIEQRSRLSRIAALVAAATVFLTDGQLSAQAPGDRSGFPGAVSAEDETNPELFMGASGEILRLWQRHGDLERGGGALFLAAESSSDQRRMLAEIRPTEKGVVLRGPDLAVSPSNEVALVYQWRRNNPRVKEVRLSRSHDGGKTWVHATAPIDPSSKAFSPSVAWGRAKTLVVVWSDERRGTRAFDVYARRSSDGGITWEAEQLLSRFSTAVPRDVFARPQLLSDGEDRFWAVWFGFKDGRSSLYLNRSVNGGRTWTEPVAVTGDSRSVYAQSLLRAGDHMLLVWVDMRTERDRIYATASRDAGATWTAPARVDHLPEDAAVSATSPAALLSPEGEALVAWQDARDGREDIFLARSTDGGRTWGTEDRRIDADEAGTAISRFPRLARAKDGRVAIAWEDDRLGFEGIYVRVRSAGDRPEWGPEIRVTPPASNLGARLPRILWALDGQLHAAWEVWDHTLGPSKGKRVDGRALKIDSR